MKILITGGAGFIGSHLVEELLNDENEILIFDNCLTGKKENLEITGNFKFIIDDFGSEILKLLKNAKILATFIDFFWSEKQVRFDGFGSNLAIRT